MLHSDFDWAFFGAVPHDHLLRGRTGALVDELRRRDFFIYYFEIPPASVLQYFKDKLSHRRGFFNFLFPRLRILPNLAIFPQPPIFPAARYETDSIRKFNQKRQVKRILKNLQPLWAKRKKPVVALVVTPWWYEIVETIHQKLPFTLIIYDCIDDLRVFCKEKQLGYYSKLQRKLVAKADLILISAQKLKEDIINLKPEAKIAFLPNGVDFDFFYQNGWNAPPPPDLEKLPRPIIGFVGSLFSWIDTNLIFAAAKSFPQASVVLVGPMRDIRIPKLPNIHLLGPKPYSLIPAYINNFDVCLIPFIADPLSDKVDPIKVYEYLSLGKPVVACNLQELEKTKELIYLSNNEKDFIRSIAEALKETKDDDLKERRIKYAQENSWKIRVSELLTIVGKELKGEGRH
ncbi:MAG: glycosyltransferase [candidate division WOR-3 bacterium]